MAVGHVREGETGLPQQGLHRAANLQGMLQGAGGLEGNLSPGLCVGARLPQGVLESLSLTEDNFTDIPRELAHPRSALGVNRILPQQVTVVGQHGRTGARGHDDGFGTGLDIRPERVDVGSQLLQRFFVSRHVMRDGSATAGSGDPNCGDSELIQYARRGDVDFRGQRRLHAAFEHENFANMAHRRPLQCWRAVFWGELGANLGWQNSTHQSRESEQHREASPVRQHLTERVAFQD